MANAGVCLLYDLRCNEHHHLASCLPLPQDCKKKWRLYKKAATFLVIDWFRANLCKLCHQTAMTHIVYAKCETEQNRFLW